jgi:hypothetical protein
MRSSGVNIKFVSWEPQFFSVVFPEGSVLLSSLFQKISLFSGVVVVERHHCLRRELIAAIVLSSATGVTVLMASLYACTLWRRSRQALDFKDTQSSGLWLFLLP